jgi:hypothetical protein
MSQPKSLAEGFFSNALATISSKQLFNGLQKQAPPVPKSADLGSAAKSVLPKK